MKYIRLFSLLFIVLFGIVLFSFLGNKDAEGFTQPSSSSSSHGISNHQNTPSTNTNMNASTNNSYDNYNHYSGTSSTLTAGSMFYGPNGGTVAVQTNSDGTQSLQIVLASGQAPMTFSQGQDTSGNDTSGNTTTTTTTESYSNYGSTVNGSAAVFYGPNGATATVVNPNNSGVAIQVQTSSGTYTYTQTAPISSSTAATAPATVTSTQYYGSTGTPIQTGSSALAYTGPQGNTVGSVTGPQGNSAYYAQGPAGNTAVTTQPGTAAVASPYYNPVANTAATNNNPYYNSLPPGIPASQILPGNEDLYILKSEIVPPVCPICPSASTSTSKSKKCAPCPACARCPEPAFDCKKVPNYNAMDDSTLPIPVLADFSSFGM